MARDSAAGSRTGTIQPLFPCSRRCRLPPASVAITGRAAAKAAKKGSVGPGLGPAATPEQIGREIKRLEAAMLRHARELEFEEAAACRDALEALRARLLELA